ncbi:hypothetical protein H5410_021727 [Solanum commersonii]|uniref:Uncharacterized protein n=1 Tax=Solanum commersonii TaxID=4109 RepID=A0A9J5ZI11_SOLCO|nr:hypothetical protein H5410_021727 [Solanum commersonii]
MVNHSDLSLLMHINHKKKKIHFKELVKKIQNKLQMRKGKLLSYGAKLSDLLNVSLMIFIRFLQNSCGIIKNKEEPLTRQRPQLVDLKGGSQVLRAMLQARKFFDQEIWWEPREGHASVWFDN